MCGAYLFSTTPCVLWPPTLPCLLAPNTLTWAAFSLPLSCSGFPTQYDVSRPCSRGAMAPRCFTIKLPFTALASHTPWSARTTTLPLRRLAGYPGGGGGIQAPGRAAPPCLTLITNCDGGALLATQHTHFCLILCLILCGSRVALVSPNMFCWSGRAKRSSGVHRQATTHSRGSPNKGGQNQNRLPQPCLHTPK